MRASEFVKGVFRKRYSISFVIVPESSDHLLDELNQAKQALVQWAARRGKNTDSVMFTAMVDADKAEAYESTICDFVKRDQDLAPIIRGLTVELLLPRTRGKPEKTVTINPAG